MPLTQEEQTKVRAQLDEMTKTIETLSSQLTNVKTSLTKESKDKE